jgi:hypothetical protein
VPAAADAMPPSRQSPARPRGAALVAALLAGLAPAACAPPPEAIDEPSERVLALPPPQLVPTQRFEAALDAAGPDAERIGAGSEALGARAEALRARAQGIAGPVIDPGARARLEAAAAGD